MINFSSFIGLIYKYLDDSDYKSGEFAADFLNEITSEEVGNFNEPTAVNNLIKGQRNFTAEVKNYIKANKKNCLETFKLWLSPKLTVISLDDLKNDFLSLIQNDINISPNKKNSLIKCLNEKEFYEFLNDLFLYSITRENIIPKKQVVPEDLNFFLEVNKICPICNESLVNTKSKKTIYRYSVIPIFPKNLSKEKKEEFEQIKKIPLDEDSNSNKICVCDICAENYIFSPTAKIYDKLVRKKTYYINQEAINKINYNVHLEDDITHIINGLYNNSKNENLTKLNLNPIKICNKIKENNLLKEKVEFNVNRYFYQIRDIFNMLEDSSDNFDLIASTFRTAYCSLKKLKLEQEDIYYRICDWMKTQLGLTEKYQTACEIITSFFVQNCEVFDEITK